VGAPLRGAALAGRSLLTAGAVGLACIVGGAVSAAKNMKEGAGESILVFFFLDWLQMIDAHTLQFHAHTYSPHLSHHYQLSFQWRLAPP
jgi:hypothetical protein